jgi:C1A family cysteine protease
MNTGYKKSTSDGLLEKGHQLHEIQDSATKLAKNLVHLLKDYFSKDDSNKEKYKNLIDTIYNLTKEKTDLNSALLNSVRLLGGDEELLCYNLASPPPPKFLQKNLEDFAISKLRLEGKLPDEDSPNVRDNPDVRDRVYFLRTEIAPARQYIVCDDKSGLQLITGPDLESKLEDAWELFGNQEKAGISNRTQIEFIFNQQESEKNIQSPITVKDYFSFFRDISSHTSQINNLEPRLGRALPDFVDLSCWCSDIREQKGVSCTAHVGVALVEYMHLYETVQQAEKSQEEEANTPSSQERFLYKNLSELFLHKAAFQLSAAKNGHEVESEGTPSVSISKVMEAMVKYGIPPENVWSEKDHEFGEELDPRCYWHGYRYRDIKYFRLDYDRNHNRMPGDLLLAQIKILLASGLPCIFAIYAPDALSKVEVDGKILFKPSSESNMSIADDSNWHALVAVGYDDHKQIGEQIGALLVRNSWGKNWGIKGYGWLPYAYFLHQDDLVGDCWSLLSLSWTKEIDFGVGVNAGFDHTAAGVGQSTTTG